ncbi:MAG: hypothetical protein H7061_09345 [Bdellovibrionaceae bacterium]|nr:hypothetical protein [Bdellovibrio sp.]
MITTRIISALMVFFGIVSAVSAGRLPSFDPYGKTNRVGNLLKERSYNFKLMVGGDASVHFHAMPEEKVKLSLNLSSIKPSLNEKSEDYVFIKDSGQKVCLMFSDSFSDSDYGQFACFIELTHSAGKRDGM